MIVENYGVRLETSRGHLVQPHAQTSATLEQIIQT